MIHLADMYWTGRAVKQDRISAYEFALLSSMRGIPEGKQKEELFAKEMDQKEINKAQSRAEDWNVKHHQLILRKLTPAGQHQN